MLVRINHKLPTLLLLVGQVRRGVIVTTEISPFVNRLEKETQLQPIGGAHLRRERENFTIS